MDFYAEAIAQAKKLGGKIEIKSKIKIQDKEDLSIAYTPGVAGVSLEIAKDRSKVWDLTTKANSVAVVSDGSAVLGLGDIGPEAALPVMEGKCVLFKEFANVDAYPIVLNTKSVDEIVSTVSAIASGFGGINLEDISAPRCFEIEDSLQDLGIPVFHDDQHGTAIVVLAALLNSLKVVGKELDDIKVVIFGAGAAGLAVARIINPASIVLIDSKGPINSERKDLNDYKAEILAGENYLQASTLEEAFSGADVFIGVSGKGKIDQGLIKRMNKKPIIFALSNPDPEIMPEEAKKAGASIVATGRSDFPNQINNVLAFPGIFRGALDNKIKRIDTKIKIKAADALAGIVEKPTSEQILPSPFSKEVVKVVATAVRNYD
ncbi:MAG: NADP-dependent malic enzyme [Candidatus Woykebacteria bacterium]